MVLIMLSFLHPQLKQAQLYFLLTSVVGRRLLMYAEQVRTQNLLLQKAPSNLFLHSPKKCNYVNSQLFRNFIISG